MTAEFPIPAVRAAFPALALKDGGHARIYFDNPAGTQVPQKVIDRTLEALIAKNANLGGYFATTVAAGELVDEAHQACADFYNAASADEIVFGQNMTTLTFALSRSLARWLKPGDEIVVTHLDHDANIAPWLLVAQDTGAVVRWVDIHPDDVTLNLDTYAAALSPQTRLVAVGYASNAVGTINDVARMVRMAHAAGALTYVDGVQSVPHLPTDVQALGTDFLACSAYKFFGPHAGLVYGRLDLLEQLPAYKVRPATNLPPGKFETGTQNHEGIVGARAAVDFLASLAEGPDRRSRLAAAQAGLHARGQQLLQRLWDGLRAVPGVTVYGPPPSAPRTPTVSFVLAGVPSQDVAVALARRAVFVSHGDFYATTVVRRLGHEPDGLVRAGCACYTNAEEVERLLEGVAELAQGRR